MRCSSVASSDGFGGCADAASVLLREAQPASVTARATTTGENQRTAWRTMNTFHLQSLCTAAGTAATTRDVETTFGSPCGVIHTA